MKAEYFFAVGTIGLSKQKSKPVSLLIAARHNKRQIQNEIGLDKKIDVTAGVLNKAIAGPNTAEEVVDLANALMTAAGIEVSRLRKDFTQAIELIFSLPMRSNIEKESYFYECLDWVRKTFGAEMVLSADIHYDESLPHCHVLVLPLHNGKRVGGALINRTALKQLTDSFFKKVAMPNGLKKPEKKLHGQRKKDAVKLIFDRLNTIQDPILKSILLDPIKEEISRNPANYLSHLSIEMNEPRPSKLKSFVSIMTSKGKGKQYEPEYDSSLTLPKQGLNPIGVSQISEVVQNLSCVGVANI